MSAVPCIVLAAGAGRRFGGPKQLAPLRGRPLIAHVLEAARPPVIVVLGAHADEIRASVDLSTAQVVHCAGWEEGQAASLRAGVAAAGDAQAAVVLLGDMPFVTREVIEGAAARLDESCDAVRTLYGGRPGHPVVLGRAVLDAVGAVRGDQGARVLLDDFRVREWEAGELCDPTDIDTPEQLEVAS